MFKLIDVLRFKGNEVKYKKLLKVYEKLFIALVGSETPDVRDFETPTVRDEAVKILNVIYDGLDWQYKHPFAPVIKCCEDAIEISCDLELSKFGSLTGKVILMLSAPSFEISKQEDNIITLHETDSDTTVGGSLRSLVINRFKEFPRAGFYDWRYVFIASDGRIHTIKQKDREELAQGRFIVHPKKLKEEVFHEIVVDMTGKNQFSNSVAANCNTPSDDDKPVIGTFANVLESIPKLKSNGITSLYLLGALERDNGVKYEGALTASAPLVCERPGVSPSALTCRRTPNRMLGGKAGFQNVIAEAKSQGVRIITQMNASISSSRFHRRYQNLLVKTLDDKGEVVVHRGTDGKHTQWDDQVLLNYRKVETLNILLEDIEALMDLGVGGIFLQEAQSFPPILGIDRAELERKDIDGASVYSDEDIVFGSVVDQNDEQGYWGYISNSDTSIAEHYPNPFIVKLIRRCWMRDPSFLLLGSTAWGRKNSLISSGVIPRDAGLAAAISQIKGRKVDKDGKITLIEAPVPPVSALYMWLLDQLSTPEGSEILHIRSICQETLPYPANIYGRSTWTAIDLMYLLPGIPMTFIGEQEGAVYRMDLRNIYSSEKTMEWKNEERMRKLKANSEKEKLRHETKRKRMLHAISNGDQQVANSFTGKHSTSPPRNNRIRTSSSETTLALMNNTLDEDDEASIDNLTEFSQPPNTFKANKLGQRSYASLSTVGSTESLRKMLEKALTTDEENNDSSVASSPSINRVNSWSTFDAHGVRDASDNREYYAPKVRSPKAISRKTLEIMESKAKQEIGPEFGFDILKVHLHYQHRLDLRMSNKVLKEGITGVVEALKPNSLNTHESVFAFIRWIQDTESPPSVPKANEVCLVASNFADNFSSFTLKLKHLNEILHPVEESDLITGFWEANDLLHEGFDEDIKNDAISSYELINNQLPVTLRPHASMCLHLKWVSVSGEDEADVRLMISALNRIDRAFKTAEYEPNSGGPAFNPSDEEVMQQLRNNYIFQIFVKALNKASEVLLFPLLITFISSSSLQCIYRTQMPLLSHYILHWPTFIKC